MRTASLLLPLVLLVAACVPGGYVKDPSPWTAAVNWSSATPVRVAVSERAFQPQVVTLRQDQAYVVEFANRGSEVGRLASDRFFRAVALDRVDARGAAGVDTTRVSALDIHPGETVAVYLVAVRPGTYELTWTRAGAAGATVAAAAQIVAP